jgi:hypothetical protein
MLRVLPAPDAPLTALRPVSVAPLAPPAVAPEPAPVPVCKPSRWWRIKQTAKLIRNGSYLIPLYARIARSLGLMVGYGELRGMVLHHDTNGNVVGATDYGLLGRKLVTSAGVNYLAADMAGGGSDIADFKYHGFGTGTTAESTAQTALITELTTEYVTNSTRPTGSQSASTNTYTTVGTLAPDSGGTLAITEHGLFSATSAGTLWDRTVFSAVNLVASADSLQSSYVCTFPSGG